MSIGKRPFLSISFVGAKCLEYFIENSTQGQFVLQGAPPNYSTVVGQRTNLAFLFLARAYRKCCYNDAV